uniref:Uncharacterized protein n=1 Tax=Arundo donax TaxID=35708 RepID=A0A0A8Z7U4_ARUDO
MRATPLHRAVFRSRWTWCHKPMTALPFAEVLPKRCIAANSLLDY